MTIKFRDLSYVFHREEALARLREVYLKNHPEHIEKLRKVKSK
jgi:hypothetical protein